LTLFRLFFESSYVRKNSMETLLTRKK